MPAPGTGDESVPIPSEPGGDTSVIAGFYDAMREDDAPDNIYVEIALNGLYSGYLLDGNCYLVAGPQTLTPENEQGDEYSLADGRSFTATVCDEDGSLIIDFFDDESDALSRACRRCRHS